jgi:hypothetical protein
MLKITIADTDWTIPAQVAEYKANGETPERAREHADTQEAYLINHSREQLPRGWWYMGGGVWEGPAITALNMETLLSAVGGLQIEACDFALNAPAE